MCSRSSFSLGNNLAIPQTNSQHSYPIHSATRQRLNFSLNAALSHQASIRSSFSHNQKAKHGGKPPLDHPPNQIARLPHSHPANQLTNKTKNRRYLRPGDNITSPKLSPCYKQHPHPTARPLSNIPLYPTHNNQASPFDSLTLAQPTKRGNTHCQNQQIWHTDSHTRGYLSNTAHSQPHSIPYCHLPNNQSNS